MLQGESFAAPPPLPPHPIAHTIFSFPTGQEIPRQFVFDARNQLFLQPVTNWSVNIPNDQRAVHLWLIDPRTGLTKSLSTSLMGQVTGYAISRELGLVVGVATLNRAAERTQYHIHTLNVKDGSSTKLSSTSTFSPQNDRFEGWFRTSNGTHVFRMGHIDPRVSTSGEGFPVTKHPCC